MRIRNLAWDALRSGYLFGRDVTSRWIESVYGEGASSSVVLQDVIDRDAPAFGRALLVYLVAPFRGQRGAESQHQNARQNLDIARSLDAHGYVIDVANWDDLAIEPEYSYDLLIGVGIGTERLAQSMSDDTTKVYVGTGTDPSFNNQAEWDRIRRVEERRGCRLQPRRLAKFRSASLQYFDAIAGFGNAFTEQTYRPHFQGPVYMFRNYEQESVPHATRRAEPARRHFLYMASGGQVHKGLDLLLDAFAQRPDLHLHVCGAFLREGDFLRCYWRELFALDNVHPVGWVDTNSDLFERLASQCAYVIIPSCAEGQIGSVVTCMHAGLIPVVTPACGLDVEDAGTILDDDSVDTIAATVADLADRPSAEVNDRSRHVLQMARSEYDRATFQRRWHQIVGAIEEL
jgi:glycosyltransferase involved in cell wall biosynthesis